MKQYKTYYDYTQALEYLNSTIDGEIIYANEIDEDDDETIDMPWVWKYWDDIKYLPDQGEYSILIKNEDGDINNLIISEYTYQDLLDNGELHQDCIDVFENAETLIDEDAAKRYAIGEENANE